MRLTNTGARCTMSGYIGVQLLANDQPRATKVTKAGDPPALVTLGQGQSGWTLMEWRYMPVPDEENTDPLCGPNPTAALITPPGATGTVRVAEDFKRVCWHGEIFLSAVTATRPT